MSKVTAIKNLGPVCEELFAGVGIETAEQIADLGAINSYVLLKLKYPRRVNIMFLYAIWTGLQGKHFNNIAVEEKAKLKSEALAKLEQMRGK